MISLVPILVFAGVGIVLSPFLAMAEQWSFPSTLAPSHRPLSAPLPKVDAEWREGWETCRASMATLSHAQGYEHGRLAARTINVMYVEEIKQLPSKFQGQVLKIRLNNRSSFATSAIVQMKKMGASKRVQGCYSARLDPLREQPWSSVHSGLVDYLTPELKQHFLSIPER